MVITHSKAKLQRVIEARCSFEEHRKQFKTEVRINVSDELCEIHVLTTIEYGYIFRDGCIKCGCCSSEGLGFPDRSRPRVLGRRGGAASGPGPSTVHGTEALPLPPTVPRPSTPPPVATAPSTSPPTELSPASGPQTLAEALARSPPTDPDEARAIYSVTCELSSSNPSEATAFLQDLADEGGHYCFLLFRQNFNKQITPVIAHGLQRLNTGAVDHPLQDETLFWCEDISAGMLPPSFIFQSSWLNAGHSVGVIDHDSFMTAAEKDLTAEGLVDTGKPSKATRSSTKPPDDTR